MSGYSEGLSGVMLSFSEEMLLTTCLACGALVMEFAQSVHDDWHERVVAVE